MEQDKHDRKDLYKINYWPIVIIAICAIVLLPLWVWIVINLSLIDVTEANEIGDALGGITAPVIGLLGAILVYVSFQAQLKANKIQFNALNEERRRYEASKLKQAHKDGFDECRKLIFDLEILSSKYDPPQVCKGFSALAHAVAADRPVDYEEVIYTLLYVLFNLRNISKECNNLIRESKNENVRSDAECTLQDITIYYRNVLGNYSIRFIESASVKGTLPQEKKKIEELHKMLCEALMLSYDFKSPWNKKAKIN